MESIYTELALYGSKNVCARTDNGFYIPKFTPGGSCMYALSCKASYALQPEVSTPTGRGVSRWGQPTDIATYRLNQPRADTVKIYIYKYKGSSKHHYQIICNI